jgi:OOP family OmpA-OmpF porin
MRKIIITSAIAGLVLTGCANHPVSTFQPFQTTELNSLVQSGHLKQRVDTFFVINDSSSSMSEAYTGTGFPGQSGSTKLAVEKELIGRINKSLSDVNMTSGLRSFGYGPCLSWGYTKLNQPLQSHSSASFDSAINSLACSSGGTPVASAFEALEADLASSTGNISVILLSDGHNYDTSPTPALLALKEKYGSKLCVSTIWVGNENEEDGQAILQGIKDTTGCGYSSTVAEMATTDGMAGFVKNVFFDAAIPVAVATAAIDGDSDGDGVPDSQDKCPNTPIGATVDVDGCWAFHGVFFDFDQATIRDGYEDTFDNAISVLEKNPSLTVEIQGHTDSIGAEDYNLDLSTRRAAAVKTHLVNRGIQASRITTKGLGESDPVASNDSKEGRAHNRRVFYKRTDI